MRTLTSWQMRLKAWLSERRSAPAPRLSAEQAAQIATDYAKAQGLSLLSTELVPDGVGEVDGELVWTLRTPTVGRWLLVKVDDATGEVFGHEEYGVR